MSDSTNEVTLQFKLIYSYNREYSLRVELSGKLMKKPKNKHIISTFFIGKSQINYWGEEDKVIFQVSYLSVGEVILTNFINEKSYYFFGQMKLHAKFFIIIQFKQIRPIIAMFPYLRKHHQVGEFRCCYRKTSYVSNYPFFTLLHE